MANFNTIYDEFEKTNDVCEFYEKYKLDNISTRFLLIRSLDKQNLIDIVSDYSTETPKTKVVELTEQAYNSSVTKSQLIDYIKGKRESIIATRETEIEGLEDVLLSFPVVNCGVRNDKIEDNVKALVRNKSIKNAQHLFDEIDSEILPKLKQYIVWSYYNQTSNDIIELCFLKHEKILPTLRKIHDIDFFIMVGDEVLPFDLKFTHISDAYFDLHSKGLIKTREVFDDFEVDATGTSEIQLIKEFYRGKKAIWNLPAYGSLSKFEIIDELTKTENKSAEKFLQGIINKRKEIVSEISTDLHPLEWWNYKYQGERLFSNNNRLFIFLAYKESLEDGRPLKGKINEIACVINDLLNNLSIDDIHEIKYHYDKDRSLIGDYTAKSISSIYSE